uniref:V-type proton ATPase subunit C n=1 Tax=Arcella intermedia TaxID=1963864 RepID=A0A6B2L549_9EUKA|eukprot:TRINITY_DN23151_c0_g1_i1.p1 TRINITY_DN23151_c0_g1~~TRINITY_DN23151_c0_g1_i1.p1  ORF type:complete len:424 (-),score=105.24 TRINITY_DN23151_c0_g1_i1:37-1308(-)
MSIYQLISVPIKSNKNATLQELKNALKASGDKDTQVWEFDIPMLKVGNIDSLIYLSDELKKSAGTIEGTIRKVATQFYDLKANEKTEAGKGDKDKKVQTIEVNNSKPEDVLTRFKWEDSRYPRKKGLPELTQTIKGSVANIEKELRDYAMDYSNQLSKLAQITANESGNLMTRDINAVIKEYNASNPHQPFKPIENKFADDSKKLIDEYNANSPANQQFSPTLTTLYVVVPKNEQKNWTKTYETLLDVADNHFIIPNSSIKLAEDSDSALNSIFIFSKDIEDFKNVCRAKRYTVRKNDPSTIIDEAEKETINKNLEKSKQKLLRWTVANFSEAFNGWLHLKSIQCFVESILRYGLCDFVAILLLPKKGSEKKLTKFLCKAYNYLGGDFNDVDDEGAGGAEEKNALGSEKYFPYVHLDINMSHL